MAGMKTKSIGIPGEEYIKDVAKAANDLVILALKKDGLVSVETEIRVRFPKGKQYEHVNLAYPMPKKTKRKPLKKRK